MAYLQGALVQLRNIEIPMESLKHVNYGSMSLILSEQESSSHPNVQTEVAEGLNSGGNGSSDIIGSVDECLRFVRNLCMHDPIKTMKSQINAACGGLSNLIQNLPSDVLDQEFVE